MNRRILGTALLVPFTLLTLYALFDVGYVGIFDYHRHSSAGWQVFTDLVIALVLVMIWMVDDARRLGRNPWPWIVGTLFLGSISPLLYLATSPAAETTGEPAPATS